MSIYDHSSVGVRKSRSVAKEMSIERCMVCEMTGYWPR